jgi:glycosyltransferase involved in cell wall biosynthesis
VRILHLEAGRHLYGGARQAGYLIDGLAARGVDNLLVCRKGHALAETANARVFEWPLGGDLDASLERRLVELALAEKPDLIHVHSRRGADTFGGRAARGAGIPAILTRRVQSAEPALWLQFKCRTYAAVVAISHAVEDELLSLGIAREKVRLIPSAVDTAAFRPNAAARARLIERYVLPEGALFVGAAAQFIPRKGHDFLLECAQAVARESAPDAGSTGLQWLLFGQGPRKAALRREARALGLEGRVHFCGFEPDWPELLPGLDLFVHPARREGLGAVVLEAMSAGVPVVAAAVGGIVDAIGDDVDGRLLPPDDPDAWVRAILALVEDRAARERLAGAARRKVESRFTIERMTDSYIELYREIADVGV